MSRAIATGLFILCLLVLGGSVAYLLRPTAHVATPISGEAVYRRAEQAVPRPAPPASPSGHIEQQTVTVNRPFRLPPGRAGGQTTAQALSERIELPKLVGASPQDAAQWQARVQQQQADHAKAVQEEIDKHPDQSNAGDASHATDGSSQILAIITALTGLIGAIATLITALKGRPA